MAKTIKNIKQRKARQENFLTKFNLDEILPQKYHLPAILLVIVILLLAFLNPLYFGGKTFESGDILSAKSMEPYINNHTDGFTLWNPLIFCGMPAYAVGTGTIWFNMISVVYTFIRQLFTDLFAVQYTTWTFFLIILGINSFLLMKYLTKNSLVSLFTALSTVFSTGIIVFLYIGHVTKLTSLCMFPLIFLLLFRMKEKIRLIDFLMLIIAFQLMLQGFHVQIIFYIAIAIAIYFVFFILQAVIKKQKDLIKKLIFSGLICISAGVIASAIQLDNFTQIYEYTQYSTRGGKSIVEKNASVENASTSEYYDYHTGWSFSPGEVLTFIVPSFYGFGSSTYNGPLTNNQPVVINTYFGQMMFVDVAMYMGVIVFFLALFGAITSWKEPFVQFLAILSFLALLTSFGRTFPVLFDFLFYHLPYFDKFRVPSMILVLVQLSTPILAGFGLMKIISLKEKRENGTIKIIKNSAFVFSALFVLSLVLKSPIADWFTGRINDFTAVHTQQAQEYTALSPYMSDMFTNDLLIAFALLTVTFWLAYSYISSKVSRDVFIAGVIILSVFDLFRIDARGQKYVDNPDISNAFNAPDYVTVIKSQNNAEPFRMINIKQDGSRGTASQNNANYNAYFMLEDFSGYSGIKPRSYQDIIDVIGPVNPTLWRMLNVKYIVADQQIPFPGFVPISQKEKEIVYRNDSALPRVYFVGTVAAKPDLSVLNDIKDNSFDPKKIAFVEDSAPKVDEPDSSAKINITEYKDETVALNADASGNNFLFFGDTFLPTGWKATIDDNKTTLYKVNHGFMGIVVPKGKHKVVFKYAPTSFYMSKFVVLSLSSLTLLGLIIGIFLELKSRKNNKEIAAKTA
jgi:hypothetical protein